MASLLPENQTITKMLGIRSVVQDENAGSRFGEGTRNKENAGRSTVFGGKAALQPLGVSTRKALGNITNMKGGENAMPGPALKPGASSSKEGRRVLGDITNSGASKRPFEQSKSKPALQPSSHSTQQPLQPVIRAPIVTRSKAEIYADEGIERLAGKSWRELEAERKQREDAEIQSRVHRLTSSLPVWRPSIKSTKVSSMLHAVNPGHTHACLLSMSMS